MDFDASWAEGTRQFQHMVGEGWTKMLQALQPVDMGALTTALQPHAPVRFVPEKLAELQKRYLEEAHALWSQGWHAAGPEAGDKRFIGESWAQNPLSAFSVAAYQLQARTLMGLVDAV